MISVDPGVDYYAEAWWDGPHLGGVAMRNIGAPWVWVGQELVLEKPQVYSHGKARKSDIVDLAISAGRLSDRAVTVHWYLPRIWKGQLPKSVHHPRILSALTEHERTCLQGWTKRDLGHILDAVGLGLYHLERLRP